MAQPAPLSQVLHLLVGSHGGGYSAILDGATKLVVAGAGGATWSRRQGRTRGKSRQERHCGSVRLQGASCGKLEWGRDHYGWWRRRCRVELVER